MKKDIKIPEVKDVFMAVVQEENQDFRSMDWNAYLVNEGELPIYTVLIVTRGYSDSQTISTMRHSLKELPPNSFAKVVFLKDEVLVLNNEFSVSSFCEGKMLHKKYIFSKNSINEKATREVPVMGKRGVVVR